MSANVKEQLLERICLFSYFALQLDESTDIMNKATLVCYVRYQHERNVFEDILFISSSIAEEISNNLNEFITSHDMDWLKCVGISRDSVQAMSEKLTRLVAWIKEIVPSVIWYHCCIQREVLVAKRIPEKLKQSFNESVKIVNFIRNRSLKSRFFSWLVKLAYLSDIFTHLSMLNLSSERKDYSFLQLKIKLKQ